MENQKHKTTALPELKTPLYARLKEGFATWLRVLNFDHTSQRDMPKILHEFLLFLEAGGCHAITEIQEEKIRAYLDHLAVRPSRKREGGLSLNYIRKHLQVIRKFARYLTESGQESFGEQIEIEGKTSNIKSILSPEEIGQLYGATGEDLLGLRDRAILGICYGCGLRKNEAISLNTADILLEKDLVLVRKGKGYKARFVPLSGANKTDIEDYLNYGRPYLVSGRKQEAFLVGILGNRFTNIFGRLQKLKAKTAITKPFGPHTLRHSIATHLIESGMELEQVKDFLGHESLESTQIYTHVSAETLVKENVTA